MDTQLQIDRGKGEKKKKANLFLLNLLEKLQESSMDALISATISRKLAQE